VGLAFFGGQNNGSVSIYDGPVNREALKKKRENQSGVREVVSRGRSIPWLECGLWT
jgi:hypothetical protein